jgi:hypothetical protein
MAGRIMRVIPVLLLATTACGDVSLTASSNFTREGKDGRGATVRIETEEISPTADGSGRR